MGATPLWGGVSGRVDGLRTGRVMGTHSKNIVKKKKKSRALSEKCAAK
jgi:hypothetical protein